MIKLPKEPLNITKKHLFVWNKGVLSGFIAFSLYGNLLKMCPKRAAENPVRERNPRWLPQS